MATAILLLVVGLVNYSKWYTWTSFLFAAIAIIVSAIKFKKLMPHFVISYAAILLPFFLMNGILTGTFIQDEVVWYNDTENLGIRIGTIPLEDFFYGMALIMWNVNLTYLFARKILEK